MLLPPIVISALEKTTGLQLQKPSDADINSFILQVKEKTGELMSINTVKRLIGRIDNGNRQPRIGTLNTIAHFLGHDNWTLLLITLSNGSSSFAPIDGELQTADLKDGQIVEVTYLPDRRLQLLYLGNNLFEVIKSVNSKLQPGDVGQITSFLLKFPLIVRHVERDGQFISQSYTAGRISGLTAVRLLQSKK